MLARKKLPHTSAQERPPEGHPGGSVVTEGGNRMSPGEWPTGPRNGQTGLRGRCRHGARGTFEQRPGTRVCAHTLTHAHSHALTCARMLKFRGTYPHTHSFTVTHFHGHILRHTHWLTASDGHRYSHIPHSCSSTELQSHTQPHTAPCSARTLDICSGTSSPASPEGHPGVQCCVASASLGHHTDQVPPQA